MHNKSHFHILMPTGKFTFGFHALVAYSLLVRRSRFGLPTSQRELGRLTGFSSNTLTKVEDCLRKNGLIVRDGYNLTAQADANGLFQVKAKDTARWQDRYKKTIIYDLAADSPLTAIENYILCGILSFNAHGKYPTTSAIAQMFCFSERTVRDKVKLLREKTLLDRNSLCATIRDEGHWLDAPPKKPTLINEKVANAVAVGWPELILLATVSPSPS